MKIKTDKIAALTVWLIITLISFHAMTHMHEVAHKETYEKYGCTNVSIQYSYLDGDQAIAKTTALCDDPAPQMKLAHQNIHTVQYLLVVPYMLLLLVLEQVIVAKNTEKKVINHGR